MDVFERLVWVVVGLGLGEAVRWLARHIDDAERRAEVEHALRSTEAQRIRQSRLATPYKRGGR